MGVFRWIDLFRQRGSNRAGVQKSSDEDPPASTTVSGNAARFVVELRSTGFRAPVNISALCPDPGPRSRRSALLRHRVVRLDSGRPRRTTTHQTFATGLLDYNPDGPISGTGEQGLTGIAVERDAVNPEIYHLYVGMLWDNGNPPGGLTHYPKVERINSQTGGLAMASRTVLLNMQPETQGQSHQISNISDRAGWKAVRPQRRRLQRLDGAKLGLIPRQGLRMNLDGSAPATIPFYNGGADRSLAITFLLTASQSVRRSLAGIGRQTLRSRKRPQRRSNGADQSRRELWLHWLRRVDDDQRHLQLGALPRAGEHHVRSAGAHSAAVSFLPANMDHAFVSESGPTYAGGPSQRQAAR